MRVQATAPGPVIGIAVGDGAGNVTAVAPLDCMGKVQFAELAGGSGVGSPAGNQYCPYCGRGEPSRSGPNNDHMHNHDETSNSGLSE